MSNFIKSNSCLLAFDSSPAFSTGEKLGLFFASLLQDVEFSVSPARTQNKQIGSQEYGVDAVNFSPDVIYNLSYVSQQDFETDMLLGALFRPDGNYQSVFSGVRDYSFNGYLFFSEQQSSDLIRQIIDNQSFSGVNVVAFGNSYLTNANISYKAGTLPRTSCSLIASNVISETLVGNYMQIPAINLESGTTGDAAQILLDPAQVSRMDATPSGVLKTWAATFQPSFENVQIPNQELTSAVVNGMDISLSIDRENSYGFGSDYVFGRDIKYPIQCSVSINGIVNQYHSGSFYELMRNEQKQTIEIFYQDPQEVFLSGLSDEQVSGISDVEHLVKNRWLKFDNCVLQEKRDAVAVNGLLEFSNQFSTSVTESRGMTFKQGEEFSIDDVLLHSADFHEVVSRDGYSPIHYPFLQCFEDDCSIVNLLSSDRQILMTLDNFIEGSLNPTCSVVSQYPEGVFASFMSVDGSYGSFFLKSGFLDVIFPGCSSFVQGSGELVNGARVYYDDGGDRLFSLVPQTRLSGEFPDTTATGTYPNYWLKLDEHKFQYSRESGVYNLEYNFEEMPTLVDPPVITGFGYQEFNAFSGGLIPSLNKITLEFTNYGLPLFASITGFSQVKIEYSSNAAETWSGFTDRNYSRLFYINYPSATLTGESIYWFRPIGERGTLRVTGAITGYINPRSWPSGAYFDEGSATFNEEGTLRWTTPMAPFGLESFDIYRRVSGVGNLSYIGSSTGYSYTDSTMVDPNVYEFRVVTRASGLVSPTGSSKPVYIEAY